MEIRFNVPELRDMYYRIKDMEIPKVAISPDDLRQITALAIVGRYALDDNKFLDKYSCGIKANEYGEFEGILTKEERQAQAVYNIIHINLACVEK